MSTRFKKTEDRRVLHPAALHAYFGQYCKKPSEFKIGLECECFAVHPKTKASLPYSGPEGVESILRRLASKFGWQEIIEGDHVIALHRGEEAVSLEPGAQVEMGLPPLKTLSEVKLKLEEFQREKDEVIKLGWVEFLPIGLQPKSALGSIEWVPKARYRWMKERFLQTGSLGHDMMRRTAATQVSLDYMSEEDAMKKLRLGFLVSPLISLLMANSPLSDGELSDWILPRVWIWENTDPARCGVPKQFIKPHATFDDYVDYVLDVPMIFIVREGEWIPISKTFREFLAKGEGTHYATLDDFELHLSTLFPDVRLRTYLEIRLMDALPIDKTLAVTAFWKGILYSQSALDGALELFRNVPENEFLDFRLESAKEGLRVNLSGKPASYYLDALLKFAKDGLVEQKESVEFLDPLLTRDKAQLLGAVL